MLASKLFLSVRKKKRMNKWLNKGLGIAFGAALLSFGLHNIHQPAGITEGGILGLILLLHHWTQITPAVFSIILDLTCYYLGYRQMGRDFLRLSVLASLFLTLFFLIWEQLPVFFPLISDYPLVAAVSGGICVGGGAGIIVRAGGSAGSDDVLALLIMRSTGWRIYAAYLFTDLTVLLLSLTYIPVQQIGYSFITVTISSLLIDIIKNLDLTGQNKEKPVPKVLD